MATTAQAFEAEVRAAWREYLDATRNKIGYRYDEVEPWAWNRLTARLRRIETRRQALARKASA